jgi:ABC-type uncharacterized transport system YnjBCD permease subunit
MKKPWNEIDPELEKIFLKLTEEERDIFFNQYMRLYILLFNY